MPVYRARLIFSVFCCLAISAVAHADVVIDWNNILLDAVRVNSTSPPKASRAMAMVQGAVYDAVNSVQRTYEPYRVDAYVPGASEEAAAATAAHNVLNNLYPAQSAVFDAALANTLAAIPDGTAKTQGINLGQNVAAQMITWRAGDHSSDVVPYNPGSDPGDWRPTPPAYAPALLPNWPEVTPFAMTSGSQFRTTGPPALGSAEYLAALDEVKILGAKVGAVRTPDQTQIANFWSDGGGTSTPPGHWNMIAQNVAASQGNTLLENARLFALLNVSLGDAAISAWDDKYAFDFWRPITAIREDGVIDDLTWEPLLITPPFPECVSGHSTFSGSAAEILAQFYGTDNISFIVGSDSTPGVYRSFSSFSEAALEAGRSRIYGGIHFQFSNIAGLNAGAELGDYVYSNFMQPVPEPAGVLLAAMGLYGSAIVLRRMKSKW